MKLLIMQFSPASFYFLRVEQCNEYYIELVRCRH